MSAAVSRVNDPDSKHLSHDEPYQGQLDVIWQTGLSIYSNINFLPVNVLKDSLSSWVTYTRTAAGGRGQADFS